MREIKFRAKDFTGKWRYGSFLERKYFDFRDGVQNFVSSYYISGIENDWTTSTVALNKEYLIISDTIGQYTGLKDKNGKRIFEGDILRNSKNDLFVVRYICGGFDCEPIKEFYKQPKISWNTLGELQNASWVEDNTEVIGNIYDNPNLLPMEANNEE